MKMAWNKELAEGEGDTFEIYFGGTLFYEIRIIMLAMKCYYKAKIHRCENTLSIIKYQTKVTITVGERTKYQRGSKLPKVTQMLRGWAEVGLRSLHSLRSFLWG